MALSTRLAIASRSRSSSPRIHSGPDSEAVSAIDFGLGDRLVEFKRLGADRREIDVAEMLLARPVLDR